MKRLLTLCATGALLLGTSFAQADVLGGVTHTVGSAVGGLTGSGPTGSPGGGGYPGGGIGGPHGTPSKVIIKAFNDNDCNGINNCSPCSVGVNCNHVQVNFDKHHPKKKHYAKSKGDGKNKQYVHKDDKKKKHGGVIVKLFNDNDCNGINNCSPCSFGVNCNHLEVNIGDQHKHHKKHGSWHPGPGPVDPPIVKVAVDFSRTSDTCSSTLREERPSIFDVRRNCTREEVRYLFN